MEYVLLASFIETWHEFINISLTHKTNSLQFKLDQKLLENMKIAKITTFKFLQKPKS